MGSAVVKPLSKRRGKTKPSDPDGNRDGSVQGNINDNVTKKNQVDNVDIGETTKPLNVDSIPDTVTELGKPTSANTSNQDADKHQHATQAPSDKSAPFYDSDEEPYPIRPARTDCSNTSDASAFSEAGKDNSHQIDVENSEKVRFAPHLPLAERRQPPLPSEHHRFRRLSCLFLTGTNVSCSPFKSFRKSGAKVASKKAAESQKEQAKSNTADRLLQPVVDTESQQVDIIEQDICCDARSPSPEYDKLVDLQIVNPSPKSADHPAVHKRQSALDVSIAEHLPEELSVSTKGCLAVGHQRSCVWETARASSETDEPAPEMVEIASEKDEPVPEAATEADDPFIEQSAPETNEDGFERGRLDLDMVAERLSEKCYAGFISTSSSKENIRDHSFDDNDTCPVQLLDRTGDLEKNSQPASQSQSVEMCFANASAHSVHTQEDVEELYRTFGVDEIKEPLPAPSMSNLQESACEEGDGELQSGQNKVVNISDIREDAQFPGPTPSVPNFPETASFHSDCMVTWPDANHDFSRFNFSAGDDLNNALCHSYTGNMCEQLSDYEFRTMSPIKEESIGYEVLHEQCACEPQSSRTSRCSSGKSIGDKERSHHSVHHTVSTENNSQFRSEHLLSSSRNSLHKSDSLHSRPVSGSRSRQTTPLSRPGSRRLSRPSMSQSQTVLDSMLKQPTPQSRPVLDSGCKSGQSTPQSRPVSGCKSRQTTPQPCPVPGCKSTTSTTSSHREEGIIEKCRPISPLEKLSPRSQDNLQRTSSHQITPAASQHFIPVGQSESSTWASGQEPTAIMSKTSSIRLEQNIELEHTYSRCRPNSEKLYAPVSLLSNASKTRPISANVLYPLGNQSLQPSGAMKLPPISGTSSMTARPFSAKQPSSKSEVFLPTPRPDSGKHTDSSQCRPHSRPGSGKHADSSQCRPHSRPGSGKHADSQSRPGSGSSRPRSSTIRPSSSGDRSSPKQYNNDVRFDRPDHSVRLSPICFKQERLDCGEQWTGQSVREVDVNECQSATDLRVTAFSVDCPQLGFGDGPHASDLCAKKTADGASASCEVLVTASQSATEESASRTNLETCSTERLSTRPDSNRPCWGDDSPLEERATPTRDAYTPQVLTLSADQIGSIRQQLYEEGLKPAERDGGVAFFIPMTVDGLQPQANGVTISDRLTRSRKSSLSYEERLILANINRQAQLHKRKEFAVKDIQNVKGATSSADTDRSKHEDEMDADLDTSF
ncbi:hypothetical protein Btru_040751 [Bulinus truncatus]|nr:hypothetical protein Btru_040751 [Bulinus truncatus]